MTLRELGDLLPRSNSSQGLSKARVSQIHIKALEKLRRAHLRQRRESKTERENTNRETKVQRITRDRVNANAYERRLRARSVKQEDRKIKKKKERTTFNSWLTSVGKMSDRFVKVTSNKAILTNSYFKSAQLAGELSILIECGKLLYTQALATEQNIYSDLIIKYSQKLNALSDAINQTHWLKGGRDQKSHTSSIIEALSDLKLIAKELSKSIPTETYSTN